MTLSPWRRRLLIVSLFTVGFLGALDHTIVSTSLSTIAGELGALEQLSWVVVSYTLAATVSLPVLGTLADRIGARTVYLGSLVMFLLASIACGFAGDIAVLAAARVVQGVSSAGLQLMGQTVIAEVTTPRERPRVLSIVGGAFPVAIVVGPVLGGLISDHLGWPWVFWINVPFGVAALVLAVLAIPALARRPARGRFDLAGALTFTTALVALVLAVTGSVETGLGPATLILVAISAAFFLAFFLVERRAAAPFLPLDIFRNRTVGGGIVLSAIVGIGLFSVVAYIPTYIQMVFRTTATVSGLVPMAIVFGMLVSSLTTGFLASRSGRYRRFAIAGTVIATAGLAAMAALPTGSPLWLAMIVMGAVGIGTGAFSSLVVAVVQSGVRPEQTGVATATLNLVRQVGATVGTAIIGAAIGIGVVAQLPAELEASTLTPEAVRGLAPELQDQVAGAYDGVLSPVFAALALVYALGIVAAVRLPAGRLANENHPATSPDEPEPEPIPRRPEPTSGRTDA
jgi:EmrB/QacA subfamily drug resistance transporter